jgi:cell wall-associated NlpC family hydrolase
MVRQTPQPDDQDSGHQDSGPVDHAAGRKRRRLYVIVGALTVAIAVFAVALRLAPEQEPAPTAAALTGPVTSTAATTPDATAPASAPPPSSSAPPPQASQESEPLPTPGARFADWVDDVAGWLDIPRRAMYAYATATVTLQQEQPDCNLSWVTLAGIGKIASDHGRAGGGEIDEDGNPAEPIGTIELRDFADRVISTPGAAGPLQLSPAVWKEFQRSATADEPDLQNIDDAALTAGQALCAGDRDLAIGDDWLAGIAALQDAPLFLHRVLATANVYGTVGQANKPPNPEALKAVNFAIDKIGLPYVWGGNGEENGDAGFDCSGLTTAAYESAGVNLPRTAHTQYGHVPLIAADEQPRLGDLIFFGDPATKIHHVGIYIGNQQMIDAPTFGQAVQVHLYRTPGDDYAGAGRPTA